MKKVSHADYSMIPGDMHFVLTETDPGEQGKGYEDFQMGEALKDVRENSKEKVVQVLSCDDGYMG